MKKQHSILFILFLFLLPVIGQAQFSGIDLQTIDVNTLSEGQIEQINNEITGRGLSITEA